MDKLSVPIDPGDKVVWGVGFVRRLELANKNGTRLSALEAIWKHPTLRFLSELDLTFSSNLDTGFIARLHELVPKSLRRLELGDEASQVLSGLAAFVAQLPHLETLVVTGKGFASRAEPFAHPTLKRIDLNIRNRSGQSDLPHLLPFLSPKSLPSVATIVIRPGVSTVDELYTRDRLGHVATSLGAKGWLKKPLHLGWVQAHDALAADDVTQLAEALGKKKLARLDLTGTKVPLALRETLAKLATELVAPNLEVGDDQIVYIEHVNKPEWGRGKLVSRKEGKVEVDFGRKIGKKVFKADAPFLKLLA